MKQYEYISVALPVSTGPSDEFQTKINEMTDILNSLGEEGWKESFVHSGYLFLRRVSPDSVLPNDPIEPGLPSLTQ